MTAKNIDGNMLSDEFAHRLSQSPTAEDTITELFDRAFAASPARTYLAILDFELVIQDEKSYLTYDIRRHWVIQQFAEFIGPLLDDSPGLADDKGQRFLIRMQMLGYSQFWECTGIQRLLYQLANIACGGDYETKLFLKSDLTTYQRYKKVRERALPLNLKLGNFIDSVYSNQIRNAFSHSDFYIDNVSPLNWLMLENHDPKNHAPIPSLELDVWSDLWIKTREFIIALFENRRKYERQLRGVTPYLVDISDEWCEGPFNITLDRRNSWQFVPIMLNKKSPHLN